jgi:hypothetical protein
VKTDIICEKGLPESEGGFSNAKMIRVYGYAIVAFGRINNFLQKERARRWEVFQHASFLSTFCLETKGGAQNSRRTQTAPRVSPASAQQPFITH